MEVLLLDSLNYNIFDMSTVPLHNSLKTAAEVLGNQRENALILSKRVENIGDIFSQSRNHCRSVCVALVLYIAPGEIVQRTEIKAVRRPAPAPLFSEWKRVRNDALLEVSFNQIQDHISRVCLSPTLLKPKFQKFFHRRELGEGHFFQYFPINWTVNIFLEENQTDKPLRTGRHPYSDFLWIQVLR